MVLNKGEYKAGIIFYATEIKRKTFKSFGIVTSGNASSFWTEEIRGGF
jgi:hypothetical protein